MRIKGNGTAIIIINPEIKYEGFAPNVEVKMAFEK